MEFSLQSAMENIRFVGQNKPEEKEEVPLADLKESVNVEVQRQKQEKLQEREQE
jgi:hypothetical protein